MTYGSESKCSTHYPTVPHKSACNSLINSKRIRLRSRLLWELGLEIAEIIMLCKCQIFLKINRWEYDIGRWMVGLLSLDICCRWSKMRNSVLEEIGEMKLEDTICSIELKWDGKITKIWYDDEMRWIRHLFIDTYKLDTLDVASSRWVICYEKREAENEEKLSIISTREMVYYWIRYDSTEISGV